MSLDIFGDLDALFSSEASKPKAEEKPQEVVPEPVNEEPPMFEKETVPVVEDPKVEFVDDKPVTKEEPSVNINDLLEGTVDNTVVEADKITESTKETVEEEIVVEEVVEKPKRGRKKKTEVTEDAPKEETKPKKKSTPKADVSNIDELGDVDEEFASTLVVHVGKNFLDQKAVIEEKMNTIVITDDMSDSVLRTMNAKLADLNRYIETISDFYVDAYENLVNKDTGLIARVRAKAEYECEGTATDKKNAGIIALANYTDPKTKKTIDLLNTANAFRSARNFCISKKEYCERIGYAISTHLKIGV